MSKSDSELVAAVRDTCLACDGVNSMAATLSTKVNDTLKGLYGSYGVKGVVMDRDKDGLTFDLYLKVKYGEKIPVLAWNVQKSVTSALDEITDEKIKAVNIHIQGVKL